jgi:hypothetical protein
VLAIFVAVLAYFGAGILIARTFDPRADLGASISLSLLSMLVIATIWAVLNWLFSVAAIFTAKDGADITQSLRAAIELSTTGKGAINIWLWMMRTAAVIAISYSSFFLFPLMLTGNRRAPLIAMLILSVAYFAFADFLYMWRLAAYIGLTEAEPQAPEMETPPQLLAPEQILLENPQLAPNAALEEMADPATEPLKADS